MARLQLVTRQSATTIAQPSKSDGPIISQLAAIDQAIARMEQACHHLATMTDQAKQLHSKLQAGTENFIGSWNAAYPDRMIRRCRGAGANPACMRYTTDPQALCQACRQE